MALGQGLDSLLSTLPKQKPAEPAAAADAGKGGVLEIAVVDIVANTQQPRSYFAEEELSNLAVSIKEHGILQPITVSERDGGGYEIIAGERRFRAAQRAGLTKVPCIIRGAGQQERLELALIENIQRQDLNAIEEGVSYKKLMDDFGLTQQQVADKVGKSRPHIANSVRLLDLDDEIQDAIKTGEFTAGKARALLSLKDKDEQLAMFRSMTGQQMSTREVEKHVARTGDESRKGSVRKDPNIIAQEQLIEERLGTKVSITSKAGKGKIVIDFHSKDELRRLLQELT